MDEPIEDLYFNWLYKKVSHPEVPTPSLTYWTLFRELHAKEFVWLLSGDDNRAEDGLELRKEFYRNISIELDQEQPWMYIGCSVLEMLIAFSRRASFLCDTNTAEEWFWIFLENLGLAELNDAKNGIHIYVSEVIDRFIWRTYARDGLGGLFPMSNAEYDQRKIEIWYQFCGYLVDQGL